MYVPTYIYVVYEKVFLKNSIFLDMYICEKHVIYKLYDINTFVISFAIRYSLEFINVLCKYNKWLRTYKIKMWY